MTIVVIDMVFRSPRDLFFLQPHCLELLLQYTFESVADVVDEPYPVCFTNKLNQVEKAGGKRMRELLRHEDDGLDPGLSWLEIGKKFVDSLGHLLPGDLLYLNPLQGPLCRKRMEKTIADGAGEHISVSVISMSINEHPLWVDQLPDKFKQKASFVLDNHQHQGTLRQNKAFVKLLQNGKMSEIKGSQYLGEVFKADGACVHYPAVVVENDLSFQRIIWSPWVKNDDTDVPWFYAVPIWIMARDTPVQMNNRSVGWRV